MRRITMRDDDAPHQIREFFTGGQGLIAISCTCRETGRGGAQGRLYEPLVPPRRRWDSHEPMEVWDAHMAAASAAERAS